MGFALPTSTLTNPVVNMGEGGAQEERVGITRGGGGMPVPSDASPVLAEAQSVGSAG